MYRQNQIVIDLGAIRHNYLLMRERVPSETRVMAVVKANAYGHGMVEVAKTVVAAGASDLAVAIPEEGIELREQGIQSSILVLGAATELAAEASIQYELTMTVFEPHMVDVLEQTAARLGKPALMHIKLDTGMNRIGLRSITEADALALALMKAPHVQVTGIYTHFADADHVSDCGNMVAYTQRQFDIFLALKARFPADIPAHASNSAMSLVSPMANFSMIREGISLYGYPPVPTELGFLPAMRWETEVVHVKQIAAGTSVGYGCTYTAPHDMRIATVAVGYGDGYHRVMSNRGQMLVCGKRVNIIGRICMDQTMIDVTNVPEVAVGAQVVLIGAQGEDHIGADEVATWADTISYEVLLAITNRVHRTYLPAQE